MTSHPTVASPLQNDQKGSKAKEKLGPGKVHAMRRGGGGQDEVRRGRGEHSSTAIDGRQHQGKV